MVAHSSSPKARGRAACSSPREIPARRALAEEVSLGSGANQVEGGLDDIGAGNRSSSLLLSCGPGGDHRARARDQPGGAGSEVSAKILR